MYLQSTSCGEIGLILHNVLNKILGYKTNGVFVEIGANDGFTGSFTYNLAKIGWNGLYCEPVPSIYYQCVKNHFNHSNVKTINIAVGKESGRLNIIEAGTLSTMDQETFNIYQNTSWAKNSFINSKVHSVEVEKLDNILKNNNIASDFDLFVLDVEGFEDNVLNGFSIRKYKPKIVIIEISDQHESFIHNKIIMKKFKWLRNYFDKNNYKLLVNDIVDNIYIRDDIFNLEYRNEFSKDIKFPQFNK